MCRRGRLRPPPPPPPRSALNQPPPPPVQSLLRHPPPRPLQRVRSRGRFFLNRVRLLRLCTRLRGYRFAATCQSGGGCSCCREISRCGHAASCCSSGAASRGRRCQAAGLPCRRAGTATSGRTGTCCGKTAGNACTASGTGRCGTCSASRTDCRRSTRSSSPDTYHGRARSCSRSNGFERRRAGGDSGRLKRGSA